MKRRYPIIGTVLVGALLVSTLYAVDLGPGSTNDPVVTKSYVDSKIASIAGGAGNSDLQEKIKNQQEIIDMMNAQLNDLKNAQSMSYQVVTVPQGKTLIGKQGTEIIVRGGEAVVVSSAAGGLQDMTEGVDVEGGQAAPRYHLLIVPKEDGRGLQVTKELIAMVRGGYTIQ